MWVTFSRGDECWYMLIPEDDETFVRERAEAMQADNDGGGWTIERVTTEVPDDAAAQA